MYVFAVSRFFRRKFKSLQRTEQNCSLPHVAVHKFNNAAVAAVFLPATRRLVKGSETCPLIIHKYTVLCFPQHMFQYDLLVSIEAYSFQIILALVTLNLGNGVRHKMQITEIIIPLFLFTIGVFLLFFCVLAMTGIRKRKSDRFYQSMPTDREMSLNIHRNITICPVCIGQHSDSSQNMQEKSCGWSVISWVMCKILRKINLTLNAFWNLVHLLVSS